MNFLRPARVTLLALLVASMARASHDASVATGSFGNATGGPNLTLRNTSTGEADIIPLDQLHESATFWTDPATGRQKVLLSGGYTRSGFWNGITVVDVQSHQTHRLPVPHRPQSIVSVE